MALSNCLQNVLSYRGCVANDTPPLLGYVNSFTGVSDLAADAIAGKKDGLNRNALYERLIALTHQRVHDDLRNNVLRTSMSRTPSGLDTRDVGRLNMNKWLAADVPYRGVQIWTNGESQMLKTRIDEVTVYSQTAQALTVWILADGFEQSYTVTTVAMPATSAFVGTIRPHVSVFGMATILAQADVTPLSETRFEAHRHGSGWCYCLDCYRDRGYWWAEDRLRIRGVSGDIGDLEYNKSNTGGLRVKASAVCDLWELHCSLLPELGPIYEATFQMLFADELRLTNDRTTAFSLNAEQRTEDSANRLYRVANETLYHKSTGLWYTYAQNLRPRIRNMADDCLPCRDVAWHYTNP